MNRPTGNMGWGKDEPPDKRRRKEDADVWGNDDWDETDFTSDQWEKIEVMCSQAYSESSQQQCPKPKTVPPVTRQKLPLSTSSINAKSASFPQTFGKKIQTNVPISLHSETKGHQSYPSVLASKSNSYPKKTANQTDINHNKNVMPRSTVPTSGQALTIQSNAPGFSISNSGIGDNATKQQENFVESLKQELEKAKEENERIKKQMQSEKEEHYSKDGQIKMLRESLARKEADVFKQRQDRNKEIEGKVQEYVEREKTHAVKEKELVEEIDKLKAALQFKDHEIAEAQSNLKKLEQRTSSPQTGVGMSPSQRSPRVGKRPLVETTKSPETPKSAKLAFPNKRTFMATESVGERSSPPVKNLKKEVLESGMSGATDVSPRATVSVKSVVDGNQSTGVKPKLRNCTLKVAGCKGAVSGRHIVARLMDHHNKTKQSEGDLVMLLNLGGSPSMGKEAVTPGTHRTRLRSQSSTESEREDQHLQAACCQLARSGIDRLLSHSCNKNTNSEILSSRTSGACQLLPIIETSLKHYIDSLSEKDSNSNSGSGSSSTKSISYESSAESLSSSIRSLELGHHLSVKGIADAALNILYKLVCYSEEVREFLLSSDGGSAVGSDQLGSGGDDVVCKLVVPRKRTPSNGSGDADRVPLSSGLLHFLFKLADPVISDEEPVNLDTTELILKILTMLAKLSNNQQMMRFQPLVANTTLSKCLALSSKPMLLTRTIELMESLTSCDKLATSFCNHTADRCLFLDVYNISLTSSKDWTIQEHTSVCEKVVNFLWTVVSNLKGGITLLLESDCTCSVEMVKALVIILNTEMIHYKISQCEHSYHVMTRGVKLLQVFCLRDQQFTDHYTEVELQFTSFISAMSILHKQMENLDEMLAMAIQDLSEFDEAFLQGEEEESPMDRS